MKAAVPASAARIAIQELPIRAGNETLLQPPIVVSDTVQFESIGRTLELASNGGAGKNHAIIG